MLLRLTRTETFEPLVVEPGRLLGRVTWQDGHSRPPRHVHPAHAEVFEVLSGRIGVRVGDHTRVCEAGDEVEVPPGTAHAMWPVGGPAAATWDCRPAGRALEWFRALDALTARGDRGVALAVTRAALVGRYDDVFRLAVPAAPVVRAGLRAWSVVAAPLLPDPR